MFSKFQNEVYYLKRENQQRKSYKETYYYSLNRFIQEYGSFNILSGFHTSLLNKVSLK